MDTGVFKNQTASGDLNTTQLVVLSKGLAASVCQVHDDYCTGDNQQFDSYDDCVDTLTSMRFGNAMEAETSSAARAIRTRPYRPSVHCLHTYRVLS